RRRGRDARCRSAHACADRQLTCRPRRRLPTRCCPEQTSCCRLLRIEDERRRPSRPGEVRRGPARSGERDLSPELLRCVDKVYRARHVCGSAAGRGPSGATSSRRCCAASTRCTRCNVSAGESRAEVATTGTDGPSPCGRLRCPGLYLNPCPAPCEGPCRSSCSATCSCRRSCQAPCGCRVPCRSQVPCRCQAPCGC